MARVAHLGEEVLHHPVAQEVLHQVDALAHSPVAAEVMHTVDAGVAVVMHQVRTLCFASTPCVPPAGSSPA